MNVLSEVVLDHAADDDAASFPSSKANKPAPSGTVLTWNCPFGGCTKVRALETGRPLGFALDHCNVCDSRIAATPESEALLNAIALHL